MAVPGNNPVATVPDGGQFSNVIKTGGMKLAGLRIPTGFTSTTVYIRSGRDPQATQDFQRVYKDGADLAITVAADKKVALAPQDFAGDDYIMIETGSAESGAKDIGVDLVAV